MTSFSNLHKEIEPELLTIRQKDIDIKDLQYKTEVHDYESILKSLKVDNNYYKKKYKSLNKKKVYVSVLEILMGVSGLAVGSSLSVTGVGATIGVPIASASAFLTSVAVLITNEYIAKLKMRYTKLRDWINMITLLYEKTLKTSMIDKKIDEKEANELKRIYNHYLEKRKDIMTSTKFSFEDVFGNTLSNEVINTEHLTKLKTFFSQNDVDQKVPLRSLNMFNFVFSINLKLNLFRPRKKTWKRKSFEPSAPPEYDY